ncbi:MAG: hypothetical protein AAFY59_19280, partial [Pseudomonadota bacterium]
KFIQKNTPGRSLWFLRLGYDRVLMDNLRRVTDPKADKAFNRRAGAILHERLTTGTVVIVSHSEKILEQYCRSAAVLKDGRLHMFDSLEDAKELYNYAN